MCATDFGPTSRIMASLGTARIGTMAWATPVLNSRAITASSGSTTAQPRALASVMISRAVSTKSGSASDLPMSTPCDSRKVLAMPPPMISLSTLHGKVLEDRDFARHLGAADQRRRRPLRFFEHGAQCSDLFQHQRAGVGRQHARQALGRGVRAMRGGEGVVDEHIARARQGGDELLIVLFFALVKAQVLEHGDSAGGEARDGVLRRIADARIDELHWLAQQVRQLGGDRRQAHRRIGGTFRSSEVRNDDDAGVARAQVLETGENAFEARCVRHFAIGHRHVEIGAHQNTLARHVRGGNRLELAKVHTGAAHFLTRSRAAAATASAVTPKCA